MSAVWIVSLVLAWVVLALLTVVVLSLLRQFGELRALLEAGGAPAIVAAQLHDEVADVEVPTVDGGSARLAGPLLLVAHQPGCATCGDVEAALALLARDASVLSVLALPRAAAAAHPSPPGLPVVAAEDLPAALRPAALPALVGISGDGRVCAIGQASGYAELREAADATTAATTRGRRLTSWGYAAVR